MFLLLVWFYKIKDIMKYWIDIMLVLEGNEKLGCMDLFLLWYVY